MRRGGNRCRIYKTRVAALALAAPCNADLITYKEEPLASHIVLNLRFDDDGLSIALAVRPL